MRSHQYSLKQKALRSPPSRWLIDGRDKEYRVLHHMNFLNIGCWSLDLFNPLELRSPTNLQWHDPCLPEHFVPFSLTLSLLLLVHEHHSHPFFQTFLYFHNNYVMIQYLPNWYPIPLSVGYVLSFSTENCWAIYIYVCIYLASCYIVTFLCGFLFWPFG